MNILCSQHHFIPLEDPEFQTTLCCRIFHSTDSYEMGADHQVNDAKAIKFGTTEYFLNCGLVSG